MNRKIWKALGIAVCMLALAAPRAMAETKVHMVTAQTNLVRLFEEINKTGDDDENVIELHENITLTGKYTLYNCKTTTIKGEGHTIFVEPNAGITVTGKGNVLNLGAEDYKGTLTIDGKTSGGSASGNAKNAFVSVLEGATANMYENVTLQNGEFADKACVVIKGSDSAFNMYGGEIENCSRAVIADSGATFYMQSGEIKNCKVNGDGVISVNDGSKFIMEGGTISGCTAVNGRGGGLYAYNSTLTIERGTISGCTADEGGGLYAINSSTNSSTVNISGGTISGCTTSEAGMGGGLYAYKSNITISRGTIENNKATYGGGVALSDSTINPVTNWTVIGNEAYKTKRGNGGIGGGIYLESRSMNVSAGSNRIYNNQAEGHGADICLEKGASITLPDAAGMGATYRDSGINIDGWYNDKPPYTPSESGQAVKELQLSGRQSLVASYKAIPVRIEIDANGGKGGSVSQTVHKGTNVILEAPTKEGHLFTGWKDEKGNSYPAGEDGKVKITVTGDMTLTAEWKKLPSAENLPKTGDESPVLLWGAVLAVSAAACFVLRRRK